ncbi:MAG: cutinase family protein [Actinomycetota bacterium]|nr:cutinase family protein [Actinomycetota bacterium]
MSLRVRNLLAAAVAATTLGTGLAATSATAAPAPADGCADVEVIGVRGTTEAPGFGNLLQPMADDIAAQSAQTVSLYALPYPATFNYLYSLNEGRAALQSRLTTESAACPGKEFVLLGYSQGAHVIGNSFDPVGTQLPAEVTDGVRAVALFGDPSFQGDEGYNRRTYDVDQNGIFARRAGALAPIAGVSAAWCDAGDVVCQAGDFGYTHGGYLRYRADAVGFALGAIG